MNQLKLADRAESQFEIRSRRYMGNKHRLLPFIKKTIDECTGGFRSFCDLFAGTGVVGHAFNDRDVRIISNDNLVSNYYPLCTFLEYDDRRIDKLRDKVRYLNGLESDRDNYFSTTYGGTFYAKKTARKIGTMRNAIKRIAEDPREERMLVSSLLYAIDRIANTVGHYDAYRTPLDRSDPVILKLPRLAEPGVNDNNAVLNKDANIVAQEVKSDVLYLDPPYNSRQYCDAYHLLENVATWKKPKTFGKAQKMDRAALKSRYCTRDAAAAFDDLIRHSKSSHIFLSYNNTTNTRNQRSNARLDDKAITKILKRKGKTAVFETSYREFAAGKSSSRSEHTERLFYCKVD